MFLDLGNTLIDESAPFAAKIQSLTKELQQAGYRVSQQDVESAVFKASAEFSPSVVTRAVELLDLAEDIAIEPIVAGPWRKDLERPFPAVTSVLSAMTGRFHLGIVANQPAGTRDRLWSYGLLDYFSVVVSSTEEGVCKPDPAIFELAIERSGCSAAEAVMVGDRVDNDIAPANALGLRTIRVLQGPARVQRPRTMLKRPDFTLDSIRDLPECLAGLK